MTSPAPARIDAMTPHLETLETVSQDLDEARAKIAATRESLQAALDLQESDIPEISQAVARLERVEAELTRIEEAIMVREGLR
jgi:chromosome segregation ATPase